MSGQESNNEKHAREFMHFWNGLTFEQQETLLDYNFCPPADPEVTKIIDLARARAEKTSRLNNLIHQLASVETLLMCLEAIDATEINAIIRSAVTNPPGYLNHGWLFDKFNALATSLRVKINAERNQLRNDSRI